MRSHSPSSSSFRSWLRAQDAGEAEKAKRDKGKWLESPTRARSNNCDTVTGGRGATVALSHPSAAAHAASSTRGSHLKRRARTTPHGLGHVAHDQRKTRAHDQRLRVACEP